MSIMQMHHGLMASSIGSSAGLIFSSDFSGLDLTTHVLTPQVGRPLAYEVARAGDGHEKELITIDGVVYNSLHASRGVMLYFEEMSASLPEQFSVEITCMKKAYTGVGSSVGFQVGASRYASYAHYNCYSSNRGLYARFSSYFTKTKLMNGFYRDFETNYKSLIYSPTQVTVPKIVGFTFNKRMQTIKAYIEGKKGVEGYVPYETEYVRLAISNDEYSGSDINILRIDIYDYDRFEEME